MAQFWHAAGRAATARRSSLDGGAIVGDRSHMRGLAMVLVLALAIGCGSGGGDNDGSGGSSGAGGAGGTGGSPPLTTPSFFDECGGKIVNAETGAIDPVEYALQARAWDLATIDCRLGPKFTDAYPGDDDPRPTLYQPPKKPVPVPSSAHLDTYQLGEYSANGDSYGVGHANVIHVPDDEQEAGVERIYVFDWRNNMISESPEASPDWTYEPDSDWAGALGHPVRHPIALARSPLGQSVNAMALFQDGLIGAMPWGGQFYKFPDAIVPTAAALTNDNEFLLVTVWDTSDAENPVGRLAVVMVHWGLPTVGVGHTHQYEGSDAVPLTLLGYVDLPFATPTFVTAAGNNGYGASIDIYFAPSVAELADPSVRAEHAQNGSDPYTWSPIGSSGYAIVLSRWENKAAFIDLQPLYQYVQTWLLGTQPNYDAATGGSVDFPTPGVWPRTFEEAPEQQPVVVSTIDVEHPLTALAGRGPKLIDQGASQTVKAHIACLDGSVKTYDVRELVNRHDEPPDALQELYSTKLPYNPGTMVWSGDIDPLDPTSTETFGVLKASFGESFLVLSRTNREISWVHADDTGAEVFRRLRDSRLDDPVGLDRLNAFHDAYLISVSDLTLHKVVTYRIGPMSGQLVRPVEDLPAPDGADAIECGGELELGGHVFQVSAANVP
jgi:hypothetical protein